ncbi:hypothetical protein L7F22_064353 [Adiantum nelumboides]|nr:hypothetical protein [Adiantum nelumboides]
MVQDKQFVARDFMGLGKMGDVKERVQSKDGSMPLKCHEADLSHLSAAAASKNNGVLFDNMAFTGNVQSAESAPERTYAPLPHPVQAWWRGESYMKRSPAVGDGVGPKTQEVGGFGGLLPKSAFSVPTPNSHAPAGFLETNQRMSAPEPTEKKDTAHLTIFYGGNVNVFNDITAEKAQAIMFLASSGNLQGLSSADVGNSSAINMAMMSPSMQGPSAVNKVISSSSVQNIGPINLSSRIQMDQRTGFTVENSQAGPNQAGFGNASMQLDLGCPGVPAPPSQDQPVVPTALPQARKASLARFLEKRRERVLSKSPYPSNSSLPEERFSSSNDIATYGPYSNSDEKKKIFLPSWMDYSSDMVVKEETKIVSV